MDEDDDDMELDDPAFDRTRRPPGFVPAPPIEVVEPGRSWVAKLIAQGHQEETRTKRTHQRDGRPNEDGARKKQKTRRGGLA